MAGIAPQISTSSFKPLSLNEIMMVPLAKQKMEDEVLAESSQYAGMSADVLSNDSAKASSIIENYKSQASSISDHVLNEGVSRSDFQKLRKLKADVQKEQSEGFLGAAMSNKKNAGSFIKDLTTKKGRQGGYSSAEAQQWAQSQTAGFKTDNEDGSFNSFSGQELHQKFDEDKLIDDAIKRVAGSVSDRTMRILKGGGVPALYQAVRTKTIEGKDLNTVMASIKNASETNPDLRKHLQQQAFFTGEENPVDFGSFGTVNGKDSEGNDVSNFGYIPGESRYAKKMAGFGLMGSTKKTTISDKFLKDEVAVSMLNGNASRDDMAKLYGLHTGEYTDLKSKDLSEVTKLNSNYEIALEDLGSKLMLKRKELEEGGLSEEEINLDKDYVLLKNNYTDSKVGHSNTKTYLDQLNKSSLLKLNKDDRGLMAADKLLKSFNGDAVALIEEEYGITEESLGKGYEMYRDHKDAEMNKKYINIIQKEAKKILALKNGVSSADNSSYDYDARLMQATGRQEGIIQDDLDADKKGIPYKKVTMPKSGKYSGSKYRLFTDLSEEFLNPSMVKISGQNSTLKDFMESDEFEKVMTNKTDFEIKQSFTIDGYSQDGVRYNEIIIRSKSNPTKIVTLQTEASNDQGMAMELYSDLAASSDNMQSLEGEKGLANLMYMPSIKTSLLRYNKSGSMVISLPGGEKTDEVKYSKNNDGSYNVSLFGEKLDFNGNFNLKGEQEVAVAIKRAIEELSIEQAKQNKQ